MIIDSHAHYSHFWFENVYKYIQYEDGKYSLMQSNRADMLQNFREFGIQLCIEPTARYSQIEHQLQVVEQYRPYLRLALGVHPKYCTDATWEDRKRLRELVFSNELIAIGETGLEYSNPPPIRTNYQKMWFFYQIRLADELNLPLILHFRDAYQDGIALLTRHRQMLHGGVAHCFNENDQTALQLIDLGFAIGIGGKLLSDKEEGLLLQEEQAQKQAAFAFAMKYKMYYVLKILVDLRR